MAFGKRGAIQSADNQNTGGFSHSVASQHKPANRPGNSEDAYVLKFSTTDAGLGLAGMALFGWLLDPVLNGASVDGKGIIVTALIAVAFLGCMVLVFNAAAGKTKLKLDATGISRDQFFHKSQMNWDDIDGFEIMSINYNKIVHAKAKKTGGLISSKKIQIPIEVFKSKNCELLNWTGAHRPDLVPLVLAVMSKVGAKKLAKQIVSGEAAPTF